jgi:hypothetical protein
MANTFLSPTAIAREVLRVLHGSTWFMSKVNKQYSDQFANSGATMSGKIGPSLLVKKPNRYTVRTTAALALQDTAEESVTINASSIAGADMYFTSADRTLTIDEFSKRYIKPAVSVIAAKIDADGLALYKDIYQQVGTPGTPPTTAITASQLFLSAQQKLTEAGAPQDGQYYAALSPYASAQTVGNLVSLFNAQKSVSDQYETGRMGSAFGFDFGVDPHTASHTTGTRTDTTPAIDGTVATQGQATVLLKAAGNALTYKVGDIFTIAAVYSVNPETKASTGSLQQFVVTEDVATTAGGAATVKISPALYSTGARQNISAMPQDNALVINLTTGGAANTSYRQNLAFHKDAFSLVTADLVMPSGVDFASRENFDGISCRVVRGYDINNDRFPCRVDVLYGWTTMYPQLACRILDK